MADNRKENFIFFIVDEDGNRRSSVWFISMSENSIIAAPQATGGSLKLSLHPSAKDNKPCQIGFNKVYAQKMISEGYKIPPLIRWSRLVTPDSGFVRVASIIFPTDYLKANFAQSPTIGLRGISKLTIAKPGNAVYVDICYTKEHPAIWCMKYPELRVGPTKFMVLPNEFVCVTVHYGVFNQQIPINRYGIPLDGAPERGRVMRNLCAFLPTEPKNGSVMVCEINGLAVKKV